MAKKGKFEIIENPNKIADKITVVKGGNLDNLLARANTAVSNMSGDFKAIYDAEVKRAYQRITTIRKDPDGRDEAWHDLRACLHDLRGQAGTFGYGLASQISDSCCKFMDRVSRQGDPEIMVVGMHVDSLLAVNAQNLKGKGGAIGEELLNGLLGVIAKYDRGGLN